MFPATTSRWVKPPGEKTSQTPAARRASCAVAGSNTSESVRTACSGLMKKGVAHACGSASTRSVLMPRSEISAARFTATVVLPDWAATFATLMTARMRLNDSSLLV
jgi:hypothetical protein